MPMISPGSSHPGTVHSVTHTHTHTLSLSLFISLMNVLNMSASTRTDQSPSTCSLCSLKHTQVGCARVQAEWLMIMMGQDLSIARTAGRFTVMLVPCLVMDGEAWLGGHA